MVLDQSEEIHVCFFTAEKKSRQPIFQKLEQNFRQNFQKKDRKNHIDVRLHKTIKMGSVMTMAVFNLKLFILSETAW